MFRLCNFIEKRLQHKCFPVNSAKFFRTPFSLNIFGQLIKVEAVTKLKINFERNGIMNWLCKHLSLTLIVVSTISESKDIVGES